MHSKLLEVQCNTPIEGRCYNQLEKKRMKEVATKSLQHY